MIKLITTTVLCLVSIAAAAQAKADIEVSYNVRSFYANGKEKNRNYHLLANNRYSKYFSPKSEQIDSINSTPEGQANYKKTQLASMQAMIAQGGIDMNKLPRKTENIYVVKSSADSILTVYDMLIDEHVYYTEKYNEMYWEIGDSTKNILGYECAMATTDYHGRKWTAWFAPEIPISDGPWKFRGLPGLILEVSVPSGIGLYADGIVTTDKSIGKIYGVEKYEKSDRKEILRARRAMIDNPQGALAAKGITVKVTDSTRLSKPDEKFDFIETDYH